MDILAAVCYHELMGVWNKKISGGLYQRMLELVGILKQNLHVLIKTLWPRIVYAINEFVVRAGKDNVVLGCILLMSVIYLSPIIPEGPKRTHMWRQADCLSITQHYYQGNGFLEPEMHILLGDDYTSGRSAGEFPLLYYAVATLWKVLGPSYWSYRLLYAIILIGGIWSFYRSLVLMFNTRFWPAWLTLLLYTSPIYIYYGVSFLTDVPAFSFVLMAIHALFLYRINGRYRLFLLSMLLIALAGLLKVSSLIAFVFLMFIYVIERFPVSTLKNEKLFRHPLREFAGLAIVPLFILGWYTYAHFYNEASGFKYTFNSIYPFWRKNAEELEQFQELFETYIISAVFHWSVLGLLFIVSIFNLLLIRKIPLLAYLSNLIILVGGASFFLLWMPLMSHHDYYYIALLILFPAILIPFYQYMRQQHFGWLQSRAVRSIAAFFLIFNFVYCTSVVYLKSDVQNIPRLLISNQKFVKMMEYFNWEKRGNYDRLVRMESFMNKLGITEDAKVVIFPDPSFNVTLYLLNRRGWTGREEFNSIQDMERLMQRGPTHLILLEDKMLKMDYLQPYLAQPIGNFEGVRIFKL